MFDRDDLQAAVAARIFRPEQVETFERFLAHRLAEADGNPRPVGQEELRFLRNFNDIFLSIGLVILLSGVMAVLSMVAGGAFGSGASAALVASALTGFFTWLLAEYFVRSRRLLLPGITLAISLAVFAAIAVGALPEVAGIKSVGPSHWATGWMVFFSVAVSALAFYVRFRLPFAAGLVAVALAALAFLSISKLDSGGDWFHGILLLSGVVTLVVAIWYDQRDPARVTRFSDNGFWLHMAAAPQIVMGALGLAGVQGGSLLLTAARQQILESSADPLGMSIAAIVLISILGVVGLALNRRALIVSGLLSFGTALGVLFSKLGVDPGSAAIFALLCLGALVTLLGGGWSTARRALLKVLPRGGIWGRIFPPEQAPFVATPTKEAA